MTVCACWIEVAFHGGHCCFRDLPDGSIDLPCGHESEGQAMRENLAAA